VEPVNPYDSMSNRLYEDIYVATFPRVFYIICLPDQSEHAANMLYVSHEQTIVGN